MLDNPGWHTAPGLRVPQGIRLVDLPPCTPELQPAETLWAHVDEPIVNKHLDTLADLAPAVAAPCVALNANRSRVKGQTSLHRWPSRITPNRLAGILLRPEQPISHGSISQEMPERELRR